jgi:hypothetical protein
MIKLSKLKFLYFLSFVLLVYFAESYGQSCPIDMNDIVDNDNFYLPPDYTTRYPLGRNRDELGLFFDSDGNFKIQIDNDIARLPYYSVKRISCPDQSVPYYFMSYDTDNGEASCGPLPCPTPFNVAPNVPHRVKITHSDREITHPVLLTKIYYINYSGGDGVAKIYISSGSINIVHLYGGNANWTDTPPSDWSPPAPTNLRAVGNTLYWDHSWEANVPETSYEVYRSTSLGGTSYSLYATTTNLSITASGGYNYKVYAVVDGVRSVGSGTYYFFAVDISGPINLTSDQTGTFTANVSGGVSPYFYEWYKSYDNVSWSSVISTSNQLSTSDSRNFYLRVNVTDNLDRVVSDIHYVNINFDKNSAGNEMLSPQQYKLQNYPNPFNPQTEIRYELPNDGKVEIRIFDIMGKEINTLVNEEKKAGVYSVIWNGTSRRGEKVSSGTYIVKLKAGKYSQTIKINLLK